MRKSVLTFALTVCLFLIIVGARWSLFDRFGSPMPDWDQWDAEAVHLLIPWFEGDDFLHHLFHPHNEHRVILTKLQNLGLTLLNGQWDARLEAVTNALLHAALAVAFWLLARRCVAPHWHAPVFLLIVALFALPFAWQNTLGGFHSQQSWLLLLSFTAIVLLPFARAWSGGWWLGASAAVLALGSMASGLLAAGVVIPVVIWRVTKREVTVRAAWPTLALASVIAAVGLLTQVEFAGHADIRAKTAHDFFLSIVHSLEWPLREAPWAPVLLWLPWSLVVWRVLRDDTDGAGTRVPAPFSPGEGRICRLAVVQSGMGILPMDRDRLAVRSDFTGGTPVPLANPSATDRQLGDAPPGERDTGWRSRRAAQTLAALGGWVLIQIVATAYARGVGGGYPDSRYMDTLAFGALTNGIALGWLLTSRVSSGRTRYSLYAISFAWLVTLGLGLRTASEMSLRFELPEVKDYYAKAEGHMRRYLATNDPQELAHPDIPFPSADALIERLAHPRLRSLMPVPLRSPLPMASAVSAGFEENNVIQIGSGDSQQRGLSPQTPPLDHAVTWGSFAAAANGGDEPRAWKSVPLTSGLGGWLKFEVAGDVGSNTGAVRLALQDEASGEVLAGIVPEERPGDTWRAAYVRAPRRSFVVGAVDASADEWLAFSAPVEMGAYSYWAWQATRHGRSLMYAAGIAAVLVAVLIWRQRRTHRPS